MPNHVTNIIRFGGEEKQVDQLLKFVSTEKLADDPESKSHLFDFNNIIPMSEELNCVSQHGNISDELDKLYKSNLKKYGFKNWYEWRIANWGTKWNCYDVDFHNDGSITFDTAWSTPEPIIEALSEKFPEIEIHVDYADQDIGHNCGKYSYLDGEIQERIEFHGKSAIKFAMKVKGIDPEDYGYDEDYNYIEED